MFARLLVIALVSLMRNPRAEGSAQEVVGDEEDAVARGPLTNSRRVAVLKTHRFFSFCQDTVKTHCCGSILAAPLLTGFGGQQWGQVLVRTSCRLTR